MINFIQNNNAKIDLYKNEISYRITCDMIKMYWPYQYENKLRKYGLVVIKPEAMINGKVSEILSILQNTGYEAVYFVQKSIDTIRVSEMWKYSWINASLEYILLNRKLFSMYESIILILRMQNPNSKSACEMLTELKGPALEAKRNPEQIRKKLNLLIIC